MYVDTASSNAIESSSKLSNVYPPSNGYEPFSMYDHSLRTPVGSTNIASNPSTYGLAPGLAPVSMLNQYSTQGLWTFLSNQIDIGRTDIVPKPEPESSNSSSIGLHTTIEQSSTVTTSEQVSPSSSDSSSQSGVVKKKARTVFTNNQLRELQSTFARKKYLTTEERVRLAKEIGLTQTKIKTWFQNRRMKWKRETNCTIPGLIPTALTSQDYFGLPNPSSMLEKSLAMSGTPAPPYPTTTSTPVPPYPTSSHIQIPSPSLPLLTPSCMSSLPQPYSSSQPYSNGLYSMNNPMLGHSLSPAQTMFNNFSPMPSISLSDTPTYDTSTSCLGGYSSKYPYQTPSTYTNRDSLLMVAPPTQSFLTL